MDIMKTEHLGVKNMKFTLKFEKNESIWYHCTIITKIRLIVLWKLNIIETGSDDEPSHIKIKHWILRNAQSKSLA